MTKCIGSFENDKKKLNNVNSLLNTQEVDLFDKGIKKLVHRFDKYLNVAENYVEK